MGIWSVLLAVLLALWVVVLNHDIRHEVAGALHRDHLAIFLPGLWRRIGHHMPRVGGIIGHHMPRVSLDRLMPLDGALERLMPFGGALRFLFPAPPPLN